VRVLNRKSDYSSWQKTVETRLQKTEKDIGEIKTDVSKILQAVSYGTRNNRANSPSRSPVGRSDLVTDVMKKVILHEIVKPLTLIIEVGHHHPYTERQINL